MYKIAYIFSLSRSDILHTCANVMFGVILRCRMNICFFVFMRAANNIDICPTNCPGPLLQPHRQVAKARVFGARAYETSIVSHHQLCIRPGISSGSNSSLRTDSTGSGCGTDKDSHAALASGGAPSPSAPATAPPSINDYELLAMIGRGGYGKVSAEA